MRFLNHQDEKVKPYRWFGNVIEMVLLCHHDGLRAERASIGDNLAKDVSCVESEGYLQAGVDFRSSGMRVSAMRRDAAGTVADADVAGDRLDSWRFW